MTWDRGGRLDEIVRKIFLGRRAIFACDSDKDGHGDIGGGRRMESKLSFPPRSQTLFESPLGRQTELAGSLASQTRIGNRVSEAIAFPNRVWERGEETEFGNEERRQSLGTRRGDRVWERARGDRVWERGKMRKGRESLGTKHETRHEEQALPMRAPCLPPRPTLTVSRCHPLTASPCRFASTGGAIGFPIFWRLF